MKILPLVRTELARLTANRLAVASLIALITVPVFYGGLYLWGNQNPYGNLKSVPAAIVIDDAGATSSGTAVNYGRAAADNLVSGKAFGWKVVSAGAARAGVDKGTYDFSITFPTTFSADLLSAADTTPTTAQLDLTTNDLNSYLSTTLAKQATEAVRVAVAEEVGQTASKKLLDAVASIRTGVVDAGTGASTLASGTATAASGAASLATGTSQLAVGANTLSAGLGTLDQQAAALPSSASALDAGAAQLAGGLTGAASKATALSSTTGAAAALAQKVQAEVATALSNAGVSSPQILTDLGTLSAETGGINAAVGGTLAPGLGTLAGGASQVAAGAATLDASAPALSSSIHSAAEGASTVASGAATASSGAASLSSGVSSLATGSSQLSSSLAKGAAAVPATTAAQRSSAAAMIANPITVKQDAITQAQNYGAGLAPFFISLSAWIGIYALFLIVRPLSRRALTAVRRPIRTTLAGWVTPAAFGIVQMIALFSVLTFALHLQIANPVGLLAFMAFVSITFAAIVLALNVLLGSVGQFLGLILMIVQLVTAGGTFPWQTLPGPLAVLHQGLPMSHAVDGVRDLMYGAPASDLVSAILPLVAWLIAALAAAALGASRQGRFRTLRELRPSAIGG
ncbi:MAG: putative rane protein [Microbacteriaceae bacterium]|nr:putative rane protein [Microbacteriaceae bacterium]